jgi:hypothetical protein
MLAVPVQRTAHILGGCACCEYVTTTPASEAARARPDQEQA